MDHLAETYLTNTKLDLVDRYHSAVHALDMNFDRVFVNLTDVGAMFKSNDDGVRLVDTDDIQYQLVQTVTSLGSQAKSGKATTRYAFLISSCLCRYSVHFHSKFSNMFV
jgi:hypothetical protein